MTYQRILFSRQIITPCMTPTPVSGLDQATIDWVNAVIADGGAVSSTQQTRVNNLIVSLKGSGSWTTLRRMWLYAGESDTHQAKIDIVALASHTVVGGETLAAGGYTGNGSTGALNTGYNPSTDGISPNTAVAGAYVRTNDSTGANLTIFGGTDVGGGFYVVLNFVGGTGNSPIFIEMGDGAFNSIANASGSTVGSWAVYSTDATHQSLDQNEAIFGSVAKTSSTFPNFSVTVGAQNNNGTLASFSNAQIAAFFFGSDFTKRTSIQSALNAYMTAWGVNVY